MSLFGIFKKNQQKRPEPAPQTQSIFQAEAASVLPENFAQSVMDLEMKLQFQESYTLQVVQELNELYRIAIEYFINVDPRKAQHFQRKLTSLLTNPTTLHVIQNKGKSAKVVKTNNLEKEVGKFNSHADIYIKSMLQNGQKKYNNNQRLIRDNLHKQEKSLKSRIEERSRSRSNKAKKEQ